MLYTLRQHLGNIGIDTSKVRYFLRVRISQKSPTYEVQQLTHMNISRNAFTLLINSSKVRWLYSLSNLKCRRKNVQK